jgi:hypothetical protein
MRGLVVELNDMLAGFKPEGDAGIPARSAS